MPRWALVLIVAAMLTGAKMIAHPAAPANATDRAGAMAAAIQAIAPKTVDDAVTITGAKADGQTVVIALRLDHNLPGALTSAERERMFDALTCRQPGYVDFVQSGGAVRYELMRPDGSLYDSMTVDHCPTTT